MTSGNVRTAVEIVVAVVGSRSSSNRWGGYSWIVDVLLPSGFQLLVRMLIKETPPVVHGILECVKITSRTLSGRGIVVSAVETVGADEYGLQACVLLQNPLPGANLQRSAFCSSVVLWKIFGSPSTIDHVVHLFRMTRPKYVVYNGSLLSKYRGTRETNFFPETEQTSGASNNVNDDGYMTCIA